MIKNIYDGIRKQLPARQKVLLSKCVFKIFNKPRFSKEGYLPLNKGIVSISADFELAWAWRYTKRHLDPLAIARRERQNFLPILTKLNQLELPITWATVGHLFLDHCTRVNGKAHHDMPRPGYFENDNWKFMTGDWYDHDPCGNYKTNPEFYAPDLIEKIVKAPIKHEIGCHSFSHCDFSESRSGQDVIHAELAACESAMRPFGLKPRSFVFPANYPGHMSLLKSFGYEVIRHKVNDLKEIGFPELLPNGLVAFHDSVAFDLDEEGWGHDYVLWKLKKYVDRAVEKKAFAHFWFHPSIDQEQMLGYLFPTLDYIANQRALGKIDIMTMVEVGNLIRQHHQDPS